MSANFRISHRQKNDGHHLLLTGDFDGGSAHELINTIQTVQKKHGRIIIHTRGLRTLYPFGRDVFRNNAARMKDARKTDFVITGPFSTKMLPENKNWS